MTETLFQIGDLTLRRMQDNPADYEILARWYADDRVLEFYGGRDRPRTLEYLREHYGPRTRGESATTACLLHQGTHPIGFMQYSLLSAEDQAAYGLEEPGRIYSIDLFVGEPSLWGHGIGTRALSALVGYLFTAREADKIIIDPQVRNLRAIRSYEKVGFRHVCLLPAHEIFEGSLQDAWLMEVERGEWSRS